MRKEWSRWQCLCGIIGEVECAPCSMSFPSSRSRALDRCPRESHAMPCVSMRTRVAGCATSSSTCSQDVRLLSLHHPDGNQPGHSLCEAGALTGEHHLVDVLVCERCLFRQPAQRASPHGDAGGFQFAPQCRPADAPQCRMAAHGTPGAGACGMKCAPAGDTTEDVGRGAHRSWDQHWLANDGKVRGQIAMARGQREGCSLAMHTEHTFLSLDHVRLQFREVVGDVVEEVDSACPDDSLKGAA